jgi:hypothetical protein
MKFQNRIIWIPQPEYFKADQGGPLHPQVVLSKLGKKRENGGKEQFSGIFGDNISTAHSYLKPPFHKMSCL